MDAQDIQSLIEALPIKKKPTFVERLMLYAFIAGIFCGGWWASGEVKEYFDGFHSQIMAAVAKGQLEQKVATESLQAQVDKNTRDIAAIEKYFVTNAALTRWAAQFQRENGRAVPGLVVPEVPPPPPAVQQN